MAEGPTIGVLTMSVGCDYFGGILGGIARTTAVAGGRMIAIQTLGAGTFDFDPPDPPDFRHPVAWDHVSAFIVILNSASTACVEAIREAGKPVVMISHELPGFPCPVVLPDNKVGVRQAVRHLVEHGHRDIAFAGFTAIRDLRERHEAYRETLIECGITPRDDLYFDTGDNRESGGDRAALAMIAAGTPSTAVVTANDLNAIGVMRTLLASGFELPRQQAIVGFDDMDGVVYLTPSLSSVRQRFEDLGGVAATLALRELAGENVPAGIYHVPTAFVARESCGCPDTLALGALADERRFATNGRHPATTPHPTATATRTPASDAAGTLAERLTEALTSSPAGQGVAPAVTAAVSVVAKSLRGAASGDPGPTVVELRRALATLHAMGERPESLVQAMRCLRRYGHRVAGEVAPLDHPAALRVLAGTEDLVVGLAQSRSRAWSNSADDFLSTLKMLYTVSKNLLRSHEKDPRGLSWIGDTHASGGCLGLWSRGPDSEGAAPEATLDVVTMFERDRGAITPPPGEVSPSAFPPRELVELADLAADEMVYVAPLNFGGSDWGMLALVAPIEAEVATGREMMNQWAALLTIALDHQAVLESLWEREEMLRHAALYDPLTELPNRTLFLDELKQAVTSECRYRDRRFAVLLLDLDGFKLVNDSLGHLAGDQLLVQVAERIRASTREVDLAARLGGDEFAVLLTDLDDPEAPITIANRIRTALAAPFRLGEEEVVVSCSIGISLSTTGYQHAEDVIRDADTAMYSAKWQRKGSHAVFDIAMHARVVGRLRTEARLRRAVETEGFELHYQPIVSLATGMPRAFEALLRWRHPSEGLVPPSEFLPVAEESGLMPTVGRWVFAESCRAVGAWRESDPALADLRMSVNVSNRQFWNTRLLDDVRESLRVTGLDPSALIIEITEGVIVHDVNAARGKLAELHDMGIELHIDDFGTGYSSLQALHQLPIDAFKIDRSFVAPLATDPKSRELVRTIIAMGANLGLKLVAEGIETVEQRDHLRCYGCDEGQGYLFSAPLCEEAAEAYLASAVERPMTGDAIETGDAAATPGAGGPYRSET